MARLDCAAREDFNTLNPGSAENSFLLSDRILAPGNSCTVDGGERGDNMASKPMRITRIAGLLGVVGALALSGCAGNEPTPVSTSMRYGGNAPASSTPSAGQLTAEQFQAFQIGQKVEGPTYSGNPDDIQLLIGNADGLQNLRVMVFSTDTAGNRVARQLTTSTTAMYTPDQTGLTIQPGRMNTGSIPDDPSIADQCNDFTTSAAITSSTADSALASDDNVCPYALYTYGSTPVPGQANASALPNPPVLLVVDGTGTIIRKQDFNTASQSVVSEAIFFWGSDSPFTSPGTGRSGGLG